MRRQAALVVLIPLLLVVASSCSGSGDGSGASSADTAAVGKLRPTREKACARAGARVVDYMFGGDSSDIPNAENAQAQLKKLKQMPKRKRLQSVRAAANTAIIICDQMAHGVAWSTTAPQVFFIPSESMIPALKVGDRVLVNKVAYKAADPERGDIVVFRAPPAAATPEIRDLVKRLVALPGETIEGRDGAIYIDGQRLDEPYLPADVQSRTFAPETVPPDSYFMLGDNRQYSKDSTFFGPIPRADLIGPATKL
jgi:signal peptidase I